MSYGSTVPNWSPGSRCPGSPRPYSGLPHPAGGLQAGGHVLHPSRNRAGRRRHAVSFSHVAESTRWFHIGLAVTRSNRRSRPSPSVNAGFCMVLPSAISASMSWMTEALPGTQRVTVAGDKGYDTKEFVQEMRGMNATPHLAQNTKRAGAASLTVEPRPSPQDSRPVALQGRPDVSYRPTSTNSASTTLSLPSSFLP